MALSNDLIAEFVKLTNGEKQPPSETTMYGTAVEYNGQIYVRLDGSDRMTPVTSTVSIKPGERVHGFWLYRHNHRLHSQKAAFRQHLSSGFR